MPVPRTKTALRAMLGSQGLSPRKLRGQHFLVDGNLVDAIVRDAAVGPEDCVLEVGTGTGILTDALADRAGRVVTCDVDRRLQEMTRGLRDWPETVRFVAADVLAGKHRLNPEVLDAWREGAAAGLRLRVISNLPYSVATPLLANLLWEGVEMHDAVVLVQKEAAERFTALPGTKEYGPMSIAVSLLAEARILRPVGKQVFWPAPRVLSALFRLEVQRPLQAAEWKRAGLPELLQIAFQHRRKVLRKSVDPDRLERAGIDPGSRPEDLAPEAWLRLLTVAET